VNDAVETVLAVELLCACQALELSKLRVPPALRPALARIRSAVPPLRSDRELAPDIESVRDALFGGLTPEA
jgi:histidine ammonia-lyase